MIPALATGAAAALDLGATRHRPADRATRRAAAFELRARGL
ncbi:MAG: hypothetical protein ACP5P4_12155 [Steroidobacteraceae bacterium]